MIKCGFDYYAMLANVPMQNLDADTNFLYEKHQVYTVKH